MAANPLQSIMVEHAPSRPLPRSSTQELSTGPAVPCCSLRSPSRLPSAPPPSPSRFVSPAPSPYSSLSAVASVGFATGEARAAARRGPGRHARVRPPAHLS
eukprot:1039229-Prymnesium_polylepis.1